MIEIPTLVKKKLSELFERFTIESLEDLFRDGFFFEGSSLEIIKNKFPEKLGNLAKLTLDAINPNDIAELDTYYDVDIHLDFESGELGPTMIILIEKSGKLTIHDILW
jgi:hypothetical protein